VEVRVYKRARALLLAHEGLKDQEIAPQVGLSHITLVNLRRRFQQERLQCIYDRPRSGRKPRFDGVLRAKITALACSDPPRGMAAGACGCWLVGWWSWAGWRVSTLIR